MADEKPDSVIHIDLARDTVGPHEQGPQNYEERMKKFVETPAPWEKKEPQAVPDIFLELIAYPDITDEPDTPEAHKTKED